MKPDTFRGQIQLLEDIPFWNYFFMIFIMQFASISKIMKQVSLKMILSNSNIYPRQSSMIINVNINFNVNLEVI